MVHGKFHKTKNQSLSHDIYRWDTLQIKGRWLFHWGNWHTSVFNFFYNSFILFLLYKELRNNRAIIIIIALWLKFARFAVLSLVNINSKVIFRTLPEVYLVLSEASSLTLLAFLLLFCPFVMITSKLFCQQFQQLFFLLSSHPSPAFTSLSADKKYYKWCQHLFNVKLSLVCILRIGEHL